MAEKTDLLPKGSDVTVTMKVAGHSVFDILCDRVISFDYAPQISTIQAQHLGNSTVSFGSSFAGYKGNATLHIPSTTSLRDFENWMVNRVRRISDWEEVSLTVKYWENAVGAYNIADDAAKWSRTFSDIVFDSFSINSTARDGFVEFSFSFSCSNAYTDDQNTIADGTAAV